MMIDKRLAEMKDLVTYSEQRPGRCFSEKKLALALNDAVAEIEELQKLIQRAPQLSERGR